MAVDTDASPSTAAQDSTRMCWECEATFKICQGSYVEAMIRYERGDNPGRTIITA